MGGFNQTDAGPDNHKEDAVSLEIGPPENNGNFQDDDVWGTLIPTRIIVVPGEEVFDDEDYIYIPATPDPPLLSPDFPILSNPFEFNLEDFALGSGNISVSLEASGEPPREGEDTGDVEESNTVRFNPPVYIQRYCRVYEHLKELMNLPKYKDISKDTGKTIMEVGCAEFGMMRYLKNMLEIGKLIFLDLDKDLLEEKSFLLKPLPAEYIQKPQRPKPLVVEAYAGCVTKVDTKLHHENHRDIFAMIGIEIVEHLYPGTLRGFEQTTFGIYSPQIVIVTTPNSDFNEVFNLPPGKFRHWDHKFEWSRSEFENWCKKVVTEFPEYTYTIEGICEGPEETRHLGCVSQMAIFEKKEVTVGMEKPIPPEYSFRVEEGAYTLVQSVEFPNYIETRSTEEITRDEFRYYLENFMFTPDALDELTYDEVKTSKVPLEKFRNLPGMPDAVKEDVSILRIVVENEGHDIIEEDDEVKVVFNVEAIAAAMEHDRQLTEDEQDYEFDIMNADFQASNSADATASTSRVDVEEESWE